MKFIASIVTIIIAIVLTSCKENNTVYMWHDKVENRIYVTVDNNPTAPSVFTISTIVADVEKQGFALYGVEGKLATYKKVVVNTSLINVRHPSISKNIGVSSNTILTMDGSSIHKRSL